MPSLAAISSILTLRMPYCITKSFAACFIRCFVSDSAIMRSKTKETFIVTKVSGNIFYFFLMSGNLYATPAVKLVHPVAYKPKKYICT